MRPMGNPPCVGGPQLEIRMGRHGGTRFRLAARFRDNPPDRHTSP